MKLSTEEGGDFDDVTADVLDRVLAGHRFGLFAILDVTEGVFVQALAADERAWWLEYRDGGRQWRVTQPLSLDRVRAAFRAALVGAEWRAGFEWELLEL